MLFEIILVSNLFISLFVAYKMGQIIKDVEMLYEGLALTMEKTGIAEQP